MNCPACKDKKELKKVGNLRLPCPYCLRGRLKLTEKDKETVIKQIKLSTMFGATSE